MKKPTLVLLFVTLASLARAQQPARDTKATAQRKAEPRKFGFTVVDAEAEKCCTDSPGTATPDGLVHITGHDPLGWRASLSCYQGLFFFKSPGLRGPLGTLTDKQKKVWMDVAVAELEPTAHGQSEMRLYTFGKEIGIWEEVGRCFIDGSIYNAANTFGVYVTSSTYLGKKPGYVVGALTTGMTADGKRMENTEALTLECIEGVQRPCVSVSPKVLWAVRNGSWIRLCDGDFKLIGTYRITSEMPR